MNTKKILTGGLAGGVAFLILGGLVYGMLLKDYMAANTNQCIMRPEEEWVWWAMIMSNLAWGFLLAIIFNWSNINTAAGGAKAAAIFGLLIGICYDMLFYSMSTMYSNLNMVCIDVLVGTVVSAIGGAVIAAVMGMGNKPAA
ncbi:MAG TPA: hypothetical protein VI757_04255 [Bacteroidia bacterium]|nr:hypothetical protein [Bacteroidia bacterium]